MSDIDLLINYITPNNKNDTVKPVDDNTKLESALSKFKAAQEAQT